MELESVRWERIRGRADQCLPRWAKGAKKLEDIFKIKDGPMVQAKIQMPQGPYGRSFGPVKNGNGPSAAIALVR